MIEDKTRSIRLSSLDKLDKNMISAVILATLTALQLLLYWRYLSDFNQFLMEAIFVVGIFWQVHQKQHQLKSAQDLAGNLLGISIILLWLLRAKYIFLSEAVVFAYVSPWLALMGYVLLIAGLRGLKQYRNEIIVCIVISVMPGVLDVLSNISLTNPNQVGQFSVEVISAQFTSFLLWYLGFEVNTEGTYVFVNGGAIDVYFGCTAIPIFFQLLRITLITILIFPKLYRNFWLPFILSFVISWIFAIVRLALIALVVNDKSAFDFWHGISGGNLFMILALITFFAIVLWISPPQTKDPKAGLSAYQPQTPNWLLLSSCVALLLILFNFIWGTSPLAGANQIADYQFPLKMNLSGWQLQDTATQPLISLAKEVPTAIRATAEPLNVLLDRRSYLYQKGNDQLSLALRYIINTSGGIKDYYSSFQGLPKPENATEVKDNDNYYLKFVNQGRQYWTACLNVEGKTTISTSQFMAYFRRINSGKLLDWFQGKRLIPDRRCLWIELSTPDNSSLTDADKMQVWQSIVDYWRSHFPPLRASKA